MFQVIYCCYELARKPVIHIRVQRRVAAWGYTKLSKKGPLLERVKKWIILEIFVHPQAVPCLTHQYGLQDWFSRLKMKIFPPCPLMCFAEQAHSSNKLLEKNISSVVKRIVDFDIFIRYLYTNTRRKIY